MKYIIKNCPNYLPEFFFLGACKCEKGSSINGKYIDNCKDVTDCILKQIAEKCKENKYVGYGAIEFENPLYSEIMQMLEIEEVNE